MLKITRSIRRSFGQPPFHHFRRQNSCAPSQRDKKNTIENYHNILLSTILHTGLQHCKEYQVLFLYTAARVCFQIQRITIKHLVTAGSTPYFRSAVIGDWTINSVYTHALDVIPQVCCSLDKFLAFLYHTPNVSSTTTTTTVRAAVGGYILGLYCLYYHFTFSLTEDVYMMILIILYHKITTTVTVGLSYVTRTRPSTMIVNTERVQTAVHAAAVHSTVDKTRGAQHKK